MPGHLPGHLLRQARRDREPWGPRLLARWAWRVARVPSSALSRRWWRLRISRGGVNRTLRWRDHLWPTARIAIISTGAVIFLFWTLRALLVVISPGGGTAVTWGIHPDRWCGGRDVECTALEESLTALAYIALASAVFLFWPLRRIRRRYRLHAHRQPRDLVTTAGTVIGTIVGRDQLCQVVMEDLRVRRARRPHVLVGGVGTGKTAVVVRLTELLARRGAVPVPIGLRGAAELDFTELARRQFLREIDDRVGSDAEGEKTWRSLLREDKIVVLADGLEEALCDGEAEGRRARDRDTQIRAAIREAHERGLPLFITSRPHAPLRGMDATIHELEPLSENDALSYISRDTPSEDDWRLSWIIEMAEVAEAPLYLQITRELNRLDLLGDIVGREAQVLQKRTYDQAALRVRLLETWKDALTRGLLHPEVPLTRQEREVTLDWLSALACVGLREDSIEVSLDASLDGVEGSLADRAARAAEDTLPGRHKLRGIDKRLAASWGVQLGLVELRGDRVRFEHSLIQAYLGSRLLGSFLAGQYWAQALGLPEAGRRAPGSEGEAGPRPGRDFLISLVLHSRRPADQWPRAGRQVLCRQLLRAADHHRDDNKALDIYAALLEIASAPGPGEADGPAPQAGQAADASPDDDAGDGTGRGCASLAEIGKEITASWKGIRSDDLQTLEEAKIGLVRRFGRALRACSPSDRDHARPVPAELGYVQLYEICCSEDSYRVRLAGAQEIGDGGCPAYHALCRGLAREGNGWRERQVSAWVMPVLVTSVDPECGHGSYERGPLGEPSPLQALLSRVGPAGRDPEPRDDWLSIPDEIALAQGFKYAANRRHGQLHTRPRAWAYLEEKALEMLGHAGYWFSELTLLQALTLWALPGGTGPGKPQDAGKPERDDGPRPDPDQVVERWLDIIAGKSGGPAGRNALPMHPFVEATADLATRALAIRQPGRFLWMDESDVVSRVGSGRPRPAPPTARGQRLWIPPSMGWSALDPEAQQLLADVLLLLNLIERGSVRKTTAERLRQANRPERARELPPCITRDRRPLQPLLPAGTPEAQQPGHGCLDGCQFRLCPYPAKGLQHHRTELGEEFCRRQYRLVRFRGLRRRSARWQGMAPGRLRVFWAQMAERARSSPG